MPEFILDTDGVVKAETGARVAFYALPILTQGYVKALFWLNTDGSTADGTYDPENGSALPVEVGFDDLAPQALAVIMADCDAFAAKAAALLEMADERGYGAERAGHDFWMTRNGTGTGFNDRDELGLQGADDDAVNALFRASNEAYEKDGDSGEYRALWGKAMAEKKRLEASGPAAGLTAIAREFGECDVYLGDDGKVWL